MGAFAKLSQLMDRGAQSDDPVGALRAAVVDCAGRARQLRLHAASAPQTQGAVELAALAVAEEALVGRFRTALLAAGGALPEPSGVQPPSTALNHWARIVQDLEGYRAAERRFGELAVHFAETWPAVAEVFEAARCEEQANGDRLRNLVARADPQAID